ncbi:unnamed protein product, partial [Nesidiocoris tenuis]
MKFNFEIKLNFEIKVNFEFKFNFEMKLNFEFKLNSTSHSPQPQLNLELTAIIYLTVS